MSTAATPPQRNDEPRTREIPRVSADDRTALNHREVVARQKEQFGGMKFGAAFFGWLAATGMVVLLTALVAGIAAALGKSQKLTLADAMTTANMQTTGLVGGIVLLLIFFVAYLCGGYVAGRMARFNGLKQGVAVWLWAIIVTVVLGAIGAIAGSKYNVLANVKGLPNVAMDNGSITTAGVLAAVGVAVVILVGALLGGLAGMRFHRRVDKVGLG